MQCSSLQTSDADLLPPAGRQKMPTTANDNLPQASLQTWDVNGCTRVRPVANEQNAAPNANLGCIAWAVSWSFPDVRIHANAAPCIPIRGGAVAFAGLACRWSCGCWQGSAANRNVRTVRNFSFRDARREASSMWWRCCWRATPTSPRQRPKREPPRCTLPRRQATSML